MDDFEKDARAMATLLTQLSSEKGYGFALVLLRLDDDEVLSATNAVDAETKKKMAGALTEADRGEGEWVTVPKAGDG